MHAFCDVEFVVFFLMLTSILLRCCCEFVFELCLVCVLSNYVFAFGGVAILFIIRCVRVCVCVCVCACVCAMCFAKCVRACLCVCVCGDHSA